MAAKARPHPRPRGQRQNRGWTPDLRLWWVASPRNQRGRRLLCDQDRMKRSLVWVPPSSPSGLETADEMVAARLRSPKNGDVCVVAVGKIAELTCGILRTAARRIAPRTNGILCPVVENIMHPLHVILFCRYWENCPSDALDSPSCNKSSIKQVCDTYSPLNGKRDCVTQS